MFKLGEKLEKDGENDETKRQQYGLPAASSRLV